MVFDEYAQYYDVLYQDKDYEGEAKYIAGLMACYVLHNIQKNVHEGAFLFDCWYGTAVLF